LFWVSVAALTFVAVCAVGGLLPVTSLAIAAAICVALGAGRVVAPGA